MSKFLRVGLIMALAATPAMALTYEPIVNWAEATGNTTGSTALYAAFAEGNTAYCALSLASNPRFTRVDNLDQAVRTTTELVTPAQWIAAGSQVYTGSITGVTPFYGFASSGDYLQFGDSITDSVWRVHKQTGAITAYVSRAQIKNYTGSTASSMASLLTGGDTAPDGEYVFWEGNTDQILKTTGPGTVTTFISQAALASLGGTPAATSIGFDSNGVMYWTNSTNDSVYKRDTDGNLSTILSPALISAVTGNSSITFKDIFAAPDGYVYFQENSSAHILRFAKADPAGTLEIYLSKTDLESGPAVGGTNVYQLSWYQNRLAFNIHSTTGAKGFYAVVPEPATLSLLALSGLAVLRRRSR